MNATEKRIRIAELLGYKIVRDEYFAVLHAPNGYWGHNCGLHLSDGEIWRGHLEPHPELPLVLPNWPESRDACAEFEASLKDDHTKQDFEIARYVHALENQVSARVPSCGWSFALATASAAQRCDAFLRVKGEKL